MSYRVTAVPTAILAALLCLGPGLLSAEEATDAHRPTYHQQILGVFVGGAHEEFGRRDNAAVLGIEYEYRLSERFGIGGILEHAYGDIDVWVYVLPFAYHNGPWKFYVAPGIEESETQSERMLRLGVEYGFHVGNWEISPQVDVDFIEREGEVYVLGLVFARGFDF